MERTIFWHVWERLLENEFIDRSVALGAKAFVSFFPAIIVVASFAPPSVRSSIADTITHRAGLTSNGLTIFHEAFATSESVKRATGVLGLLFTFFYVNSFTSALQRVYLRAWRRPRSGRVSGYALGAIWLAGFVVYLSMVGGARAVLGHGVGVAGFGVLALAGAVGLWWITPWIMLGRAVRLRALLPTGLLTGLAMTAYALTATVWMPRSVHQNQNQFGFFGVTLSLVTWLSGAAMVVVVCACAAPVLAEDPGTVGRLARGRSLTVLAPGAAPSLEPPPRPHGFARAVGLGADDEADG